MSAVIRLDPDPLNASVGAIESVDDGMRNAAFPDTSYFLVNVEIWLT